MRNSLHIQTPKEDHGFREKAMRSDEILISRSKNIRKINPAEYVPPDHLRMGCFLYLQNALPNCHDARAESCNNTTLWQK